MQRPVGALPTWKNVIVSVAGPVAGFLLAGHGSVAILDWLCASDWFGSVRGSSIDMIWNTSVVDQHRSWGILRQPGTLPAA